MVVVQPKDGPVDKSLRLACMCPFHADDHLLVCRPRLPEAGQESIVSVLLAGCPATVVM
jgi:hypothetical protein